MGAAPPLFPEYSESKGLIKQPGKSLARNSICSFFSGERHLFKLSLRAIFYALVEKGLFPGKMKTP
jgi:hypothetical protein